MGERTSTRTNCYDFLRLFAAVAVVVQHATVHLNERFLWLKPGGAWWFYDGVPMFFIISGLFVYRSAVQLGGRGRWRDYFRNRFLRVGPALYVYAVVAVLVLLLGSVLTVNALVQPKTLAWLASNFTLTPIYNPPALRHFGVGVINGSLWSIPAEVSFYLAVPLLVLVAARFGFRRMLTALLTTGAVLLVATAHAPSSPQRALNDTLFPYLWFFGLGIFWYAQRQRMPRSGWVPIAAAAAYVGVTASFDNLGRGFEYRALLAGIPLSVLIVWIGEYGWAGLQRFRLRVGDLSYGTYVWHMLIVNALIFWRVPARIGVHGTAAILGVLAATLVVAWLSWHLIEQPALALKRRSSRTAPPRRPAPQMPEVVPAR